MTQYVGLRVVGTAGVAVARPVTALPAAANVGDQVILASDRHVYEWDGASWDDLGAAGASGGGVALSAGTASASAGTVVFSNSNGVSFGLNGSTVTASVAAGPAAGIGGIAAGTQTATSGTVIYSNSNGLTFGMAGSASVTGSHDGFRSVSAGTTHALGPGLSFGNANGISFGANGSTVTASYTVPNTAGLISAINLSAGTTSTNASAITAGNANGVSFGMNGATLTASVGAGATATGNLGAMAAGTQTATSGTVAFANSNGVTFGMSGSNQITASYTVPSTAGLISAINVSGGTTSNNLTQLVFANGGNVSFGLNGSTITATAPSGGGGGTTLSSYEPFPLVANTGTSALSLSSNTSAAMMLFPFDLRAPVAAEVLGVAISANFTTGGTSSFRQSGTLMWGLYSRPTGTASTELRIMGSSQLGYSVTYNNSTITLSHHTTTNFGAADYGYGTTTSAGLNITSGYTGLKLYNLNLGSTLTPGHYWLGIHHRNSSSSFNSGLRLSIYGAAWSLSGFAPLGSFSSAQSTGTNVPLGLGGNMMLGLGSYSLAALTSLPATITMSQVSQAGVNVLPYMRLSTRVTA